MFRPVLAAALFLAFPAASLGQATVEASDRATVRLVPRAPGVTVALTPPSSTTVPLETLPGIAMPLSDGSRINVTINEPDRVATEIENGRVSVTLPPEPAPPSPETVAAPVPMPVVTTPTIEELLGAGQTVQIIGLQFEFDSAVLTDESRPALDAVGGVLAADPSLQVLVRGHTDAQGPAAYNLNLSQRRAEAVRVALIAWYGIGPDRIRTEGLGMSEPVATNATEEGRQQNRRVEFVPIQ